MTVMLQNVLWQGTAILFGGTLVGMFYKGLDRRLAARMQSRMGPPLRQPFFDVAKLMVKENVVPRHAVAWLYNLMPVVSLVAVAALLFYIPLGGYPALLAGYGDLILVLYLLVVPSLAMMLGGYAAGSPYATVGAQREMVMMMAYEFPLAVTAVSLAWRLSTILPGEATFSLSVLAANPLWGLVGPLGIVGLILLFGAMLVVTPAELAKIPFDIPEAETEIAGGLLTEYSGRNLALFYLADAIKMVAMGSLTVALFVPYGLADLCGLAGVWGAVVDVAFYLVKLFAVVFVSVIVARVGFARLKIAQATRLFWLPVTGLSLLGLVLLALDRIVIV
jgi:NADH-quinone oxidoreductase subunit H